MRFLGNSEAKTDAKGRVFLPAVFRKQLQAASQECLILRKDTYQDCLVLYPENVWNEQMNETTLQTQSLEFQTPNDFPSVRFGCRSYHIGWKRALSDSKTIFEIS